MGCGEKQLWQESSSFYLHSLCLCEALLTREISLKLLLLHIWELKISFHPLQSIFAFSVQTLPINLPHHGLCHVTVSSLPKTLNGSHITSTLKYRLNFPFLGIPHSSSLPISSPHFSMKSSWAPAVTVIHTALGHSDIRR